MTALKKSKHLKNYTTPIILKPPESWYMIVYSLLITCSLVSANDAYRIENPLYASRNII